MQPLSRRSSSVSMGLKVGRNLTADTAVKHAQAQAQAVAGAQAPATVISPINRGGALTAPPERDPAGLGTRRPHGLEHRDEVAGDRELAQRLGQLAGADRAARGADREDA